MFLCGVFSVDRADQLALQHPQHGFQVMAAFEDLPIHTDNRILPLPFAQLGMLFYAVQREFRSPPEHRKHGHFPQRLNPIVAPFSGGDHAPIDRQNNRQFTAIECNLRGEGRRRNRFNLLNAHTPRVAAIVSQIKPFGRCGPIFCESVRDPIPWACSVDPGRGPLQQAVIPAVLVGPVSA